MLTIPLARLEREGTLDIQAEIPPGDAIWEGLGFGFSTPLTIFGKAEWFTSGEVLVTVTLRGRRAQECRRCLEPVVVPVHEELSLLFVPPGEERGNGEEDFTRILPVEARELELAGVIREELILSERPYFLCREDCRGICPICGVNLNEESCQCSTEELDPRWDALRALKDERD
ncbi:MAG: YceD family protein [Gemmatimonadota bacterium]